MIRKWLELEKQLWCIRVELFYLKSKKLKLTVLRSLLVWFSGNEWE